MGDCGEEKVAQDSVEACAEDCSEVLSEKACGKRLLGISVQEHGIALSFPMYIFDVCILMKHKML